MEIQSQKKNPGGQHEGRESEIAGLAQSAARTPPPPPRGGRSSPARTFSPARRADPSEAGAGADLNC
jgi:hypothetical protein